MPSGKITDVAQYAAAGLVLAEKARWRDGFMDRPGFAWEFAGQPLRVPEIVCEILNVLREGPATTYTIKNAIPVLLSLKLSDFGQMLAWVNVFTTIAGSQSNQIRELNLIGRELLRQWDRARAKPSLFVVGKPRLLSELVEESPALAEWLHAAAPGDVRTLADGTAVVATRRG